MEIFSEFINDLGLLEPNTKGGSFTWSSLRENPTYNKLDRFLMSIELAILWPRLSQFILPRGLSDHNPMSLGQENFDWGSKPFKWFDNWFEERELMVKIQNACEAGKGLGISKILKIVKNST
ncbi:hypothetical protein HRI_004450000 [Hibiscus trionum]|uniref:Endonuclease/exonuclease/phosphatase domain-containing protein n=1 Tax=Hibiscus trionum TaxID=183268 RepID=A0A9W7MK87_HIBTR|nr:hypothetical protein HRI_004450000 [Hibiscus trionum]